MKKDNDKQNSMTRRNFITVAGLAAGGLVLVKFVPSALAKGANSMTGTSGEVRVIDFSDHGKRKGPIKVKKVVKTDAEWKKLLSEDEFTIGRKAGTEPPFTGEYAETHEKGLFRCRSCSNALFSSDTKFESGTGWPSFWAPIAKENIWTRSDKTLGAERTEVLCKKCDAHLGHVFDDGPEPTHLRYCMNSASLKFIKA